MPVAFTVTDKGGNTATSSTNVDIVPYITDFSRQTPFVNRLSDNTMNPGAGGYYPVYQGNTGYTISGFNLYYSSASASVGSTALTVTNPSTTSLTVAIPSALTTGALAVTTNGVPSINNTNAYTSSSSTNSNGVAYSSILTTEDNFSDDRMIYVDSQAPSITIAPFGQKYPVQATDDATNGTKTLTSVSDYTDNVPYTGTDKTKKSKWLGHVEYASDNTVSTNQSALSGVVTFKGKASDNQRISKITCTIGNSTTGFNGGKGTGTEFEIYSLANGFEYWNGSAYASTGTSFTGSS